MATDLSKPFPPVVGKPGRLCTRSLWAEREPQWWLIGPIDGLSFTGFCEWLLAPALHPGDLVVMDNRSSHRSASVRSAIEAAGAEVVLLPPYSPDPNPTEMVFSKPKQLIRSQRPRTFPEIVDATGNALEFIQ